MGPDRPQDTSPDVAARMIEGYRRMPASEKLAQVSRLTLAVQELAALDVRRRYPDASDREVQLRVASRWLGPELMLRAFGWDVAEQGY